MLLNQHNVAQNSKIAIFTLFINLSMQKTW